MIADIAVREKSFGSKVLMTGVAFTVNDGEKVGLIGRNGIGKSTLFGILAGDDKDFSGEVVYKRGTVVVATRQEHHGLDNQTVLQYILAGLPEYPRLSHILETYPLAMGNDMKKILEYSEALERFTAKGFYQIEEQIERELDNFQLHGVAHQLFASLSGGEKRLVEIVKVMHSDADLALIDEPTNHMDYVAKAQFIDWLQQASEAMLVITHDRDVLHEVDRIIELKDGVSLSFKGNYQAYLRQNTAHTSAQMNEYEVTQRQIDNLKKRVHYARSKKAAWGGTADKKNPFVVMEEKALREIKRLEATARPSFWIDKTSVEAMDYKAKQRYDKYKARNIRMNIKNNEPRSKRVLAWAKDLSLGYNTPLFSGVNIDLREGEALELRGRNGAGKTTLIKTLLNHSAAAPWSGEARSARKQAVNVVQFSGEIGLDKHARIGVYEQEVSPVYFDLPLEAAIERMYLDRDLPISTSKIRSLMNDYLFTDADRKIPVRQLSGGQKARFQLISMLANDPQLLVLDEPTNHLDLPSIEELEVALKKYSGAILYVSHDGYFRQALGGDVVEIGAKQPLRVPSHE